MTWLALNFLFIKTPPQSPLVVLKKYISITSQHWLVPFIALVENLSLHTKVKVMTLGAHSSWTFEVVIFTLWTYEETKGVSHCGLAIYIKKYLKEKEELWKFKYFTMKKL